MRKLTKSEYDKFKRYFNYYVDLFGLRDWDFHFTRDSQGDQEAFAAVRCDTYSRQCVVYLCSEYPEEMHSNTILDEVALHEALHVVIADFTEAAMSRGATEDSLKVMNERLVVQLCNAWKKG